MGAPWSKELRDKMVVLYNSGMETFEIAKEFGVTENCIRSHFAHARKGIWGEEYIDKFPLKGRGGKPGARGPHIPKPKIKPNTLDADLAEKDRLKMRYGDYMAMKDGLIPSKERMIPCRSSKVSYLRCAGRCRPGLCSGAA